MARAKMAIIRAYFGKMAIIRDYFGMRPGDSLKDFAAEIKQLSEEEKTELAQGAAIALGLTQEEVAFPLVNES